MSQQYKNSLLTIMNEAGVLSLNTIMIKGKQITIPPTSNPSNNQENLNLLIEHLQKHIYGEYYCKAKTTNDPNQKMDPAFLEKLSEANVLKGKWDSDWQITQMDQQGGIHVKKGNETRYCHNGQYQILQNSSQMAPTALIFLAGESKDTQIGFYHVFNYERSSMNIVGEYTRIYWNISHEGATTLVSELTKKLSFYKIPFRFKIASSPHLYNRSDSSILYFLKPYYNNVIFHLEEVNSKIEKFLSEDIPLFSKKFKPGIGIAEDPGNGESFGMHRCKIVAESLYQSYLNSRNSPNEKLVDLEAHFSRYNLSLESPYLNPFSIDIYESQRN